jgi:hypothetical protein
VTWSWQLRAADGAPVTAFGAPGNAVPTHPTQSDAETWLGEFWRGLAADGVADASLYRDGDLVYGPMPLTE